MLAFNNSPERKLALTARLHEVESGQPLIDRPIHWNGTAGSLVGSLLASEDLDAWQDRFGLPKWLALAVDSVLCASPSRREGTIRSAGLLEGLPVGLDMEKAGSRYLLMLLDALAPGERLAEACALVAELHRKRVAGESVPPSEWRRARAVALEHTDMVASEGGQSEIGACIEAACWDPATSRTVVSDSLRYWINAMGARALQEFGWTSADDKRIQKLLDGVHQAALAGGANPEEGIDVFKLLELHHAEEAARLRAWVATQNKQAEVQWRLAVNLLETALQAVPQTPAIIPRTKLFSNPERAGLTISPDGKWLAWVANGGGVMNIWSAPRDQPDAARQVTFDEHRGVHGFSWTFQAGLLLYSQDQDGDENWRLFAADVATGEIRALTPPVAEVRATLHSVSRLRREEVLIEMNERDSRYGDLYLLNLLSGDTSMLEENPGFAGYVTDQCYQVRMAISSTPDGGCELVKRSAVGEWELWMTLGPDDASVSGPAGFSADGKTLYFKDSRGRDTAALVAIDMGTGATTLLADDEQADIGGTIDDPVDDRPLAYSVTYERYRLHVLDEVIRPDIEFLDESGIGEWWLDSRTEDNAHWLVCATSDLHPGATYLYDRGDQTLTRLLDWRPELKGMRLARMQSTVIEARDGLKMVSYLTLPAEVDAGQALTARQPVPLVLMVHGGPWSRDGFGYNSTHQWLANRGYAVLSVNFRGSIGFGKSHIDAAVGEWGRKMDEDLEDAVQWAVDREIADPGRLGIYGGSYGGYAVLSALTRYPDRYACGVDIVGPSNLETLLASIPPYWEAGRAMQYRAIGNPETDAGRALLSDRSPLHRAGSIKAPLLVAQGGNDPRVKQAEAEQMVEALRTRSIPVTYVLYPDEGHGFVREANRMSFNALCEGFLAKHLGGREESWKESDFPGTSMRMVDVSRKRA